MVLGQHGFSRQYVNDVVLGRRNADAEALLTALGLPRPPIGGDFRDAVFLGLLKALIPDLTLFIEQRFQRR